MLSIYLLIPLSLMLFVVAIWAVRYAVRSNQFEDLDNASQRIILDDRQERRQTIQAHDQAVNPVDKKVDKKTHDSQAPINESSSVTNVTSTDVDTD